MSDDDIELLIDWDDEPPLWAMAAAQRNSDADRFLDSLAITKWDNDEFIKLIIEKTTEGAHYISTSPYSVNGPDDEFMTWLSNKPVDWHQKLYSHIYSELSPSGGCRRLRGLQIVRLDTGLYSVGTKCFFPSEGGEQNDVLLRVATDAYTSGKSKTEQESAKKLLTEIGVRDVGEAEHVEAILKQRYTCTAEVPDEKTYHRDLRRFVSLVEKEPDKAKLFAEYFIFDCKGDQWCLPPGVFLDNPFMETGLAAYYDALGTEASCFALVERYRNCGIAVKSLLKFAQSVGVQTHLVVQRKSVSGHPSERQLTDWYSAAVRRTNSEVNEDWFIPNLSELLECPTIALSKLIWNTVRVADVRVVTARYRPNQQYPLRIAPSSLVLALQQNAWIPQGEGSFVRPAEALRDLLPEGFAFDPGWPWLKEIGFGQDVVKKSEEERQKQAIAKEFGFLDSDSLERAKRFAALPREEQERILSECEDSAATELPDNESGNAARRAARVIAQAALAPERQTEVRNRSVSIGREEVKEYAAQYLRQQYTNADGQMICQVCICQVCKGPLPFKLDDGSDYFERVEFLKDLRKRHYQNYLALCPNHAAMFQHANGSAELIREMFSEIVGNELEVVLAQQDATIYFTKTHIADLRSVLEAEKTSVAGDCAEA